MAKEQQIANEINEKLPYLIRDAIYDKFDYLTDNFDSIVDGMEDLTESMKAVVKQNHKDYVCAMARQSYAGY